MTGGNGAPARTAAQVDQILKAMADSFGRQLRSFDAYKDRFVSFGMSDAIAQDRTPENSTPTSFRQWCEQVLKPAVT